MDHIKNYQIYREPMAVQAKRITDKATALEEIAKLKEILHQRKIEEQEAASRYEAELLMLGAAAWQAASDSDRRVLVIAAFRDYRIAPKAWDDYTTAERLQLVKAIKRVIDWAGKWAPQIEQASAEASIQ